MNSACFIILGFNCSLNSMFCSTFIIRRLGTIGGYNKSLNQSDSTRIG